MFATIIPPAANRTAQNFQQVPPGKSPEADQGDSHYYWPAFSSVVGVCLIIAYVLVIVWFVAAFSSVAASAFGFLAVLSRLCHQRFMKCSLISLHADRLTTRLDKLHAEKTVYYRDIIGFREQGDDLVLIVKTGGRKSHAVLPLSKLTTSSRADLLCRLQAYLSHPSLHR